MRMLQQFTKEGILVSILKSNEKYILKLEIGPFEQVYKFLESDAIQDEKSVANLLTIEFIGKVFEVFDNMNSNYIKVK